MFGDERYAPGLRQCFECNKSFFGGWSHCLDCRRDRDRFRAAHDAWLEERAAQENSVNPPPAPEPSMTGDQAGKINEAIKECEAAARFIRSQTPETLRTWAAQIELGIAFDAVGLDRAVSRLREVVENRLELR